MIIDFTARRRAAIEAQRLERIEWEAENERDHKIWSAELEFEAQMEREHIKRQKYERAIAEKRAIMQPKED